MQRLVATLALVLSFPVASSAALMTYTSKSAFEAAGTLAYESTFTDFGTGFASPGNPFTRGDVTYTSRDNLTWGAETTYTKTETLIGNNYWTPLTGTIAMGPQYDMFGFNVGTYGGSLITFTLFTNQGTYVHASQAIANSALGELSFRGFTLGGGEYFTGFSISSDSGTFGYLTGITHVQVGHTGAPVPEPVSATLLGLGLASLVARRERRRRQG